MKRIITRMKPLEIIFKNEDYIVANKPSGLLTMPGRGAAAGEKNLLALLSHELKQRIYPALLQNAENISFPKSGFPAESSQKSGVYVVHRLDKDASGLILFARSASAHKYFSALFETRRIEKKYLAAVHGIVKAGGAVDKPVQAYGSGRMGVGFDGKASVTKYEALEHYKCATLLEVSPESGRRHQIRVHMYHIGHPIIGDRLYGDRAEQRKYPRLMLHSYSLKFKDMRGEKQAFKADPPKDFLGALSCL